MGEIENYLNGLSLLTRILLTNHWLRCAGAHAHYKSFENNMVKLMVTRYKHLERFGTAVYYILFAKSNNKKNSSPQISYYYNIKMVVVITRLPKTIRR